MKLSQIDDTSEDRWVVRVLGAKQEDFELDTRGQVYSLIRHALELGFPAEDISISRKLKADYSFEGE